MNGTGLKKKIIDVARNSHRDERDGYGPKVGLCVDQRRP